MAWDMAGGSFRVRLISFASPCATIFRPSSGNRLCRASPHGAHSQTLPVVIVELTTFTHNKNNQFNQGEL
jgi:hypothetical protein